MARLPVKIEIDRLDVLNALFNDFPLIFKVHGESLSLRSVTNIARIGWLEHEVSGQLCHERYGKTVPNAKLVCTVGKTDGVLTVEVGDPDAEGKEEYSAIDRLCLRCPKCGSQSRLAQQEPKMYEGAHIRECLTCRDVCEYDDKCTWPHSFTVQNLEGRPEHHITWCDDPHNHE